MTQTRIVNSNTLDLIKSMCAGCCERATAMRSKAKGKVPEELTIATVNDMALNYIIGACACAAALGIPELEQHLKHFLLTEVSLKGYVAIEQMALTRH